MKDATRVWKNDFVYYEGRWYAWFWNNMQMYICGNSNIGLKKCDLLPGDLKNVPELHGVERVQMLKKVGLK